MTYDRGWEQMLAQSFHPRDWFSGARDEAPDDGHEAGTEVDIMWVYRRLDDGIYSVGYYTPHGEWVQESAHDSSDEAAGRVHRLNGGD